MYQKLASHNPDLQRLIDSGYAVSIDSNHLVIRDIPYLDDKGELKWGAIVAKLNFINKDEFIQQDHQIYFAGSAPYCLNGKPVPNLGGGPCKIPLSDNCSDVIIERSFSNKPKKEGKYKDHFHKIETYVGFISGPAMQKYDVSPYTFNAQDEPDVTSVFKFRDTLTSRAEITDLSDKFKNDTVAIIGLGGTGGYILDFLVKTPVKEIRGFDKDKYHVHNSFRSPGTTVESEFNESKAIVYQRRYESFRTNVNLKSKYIDESCKDELEGVTFAFVCVDNGDSRSEIFDLLIKLEIPFIDVGMGLQRRNNQLTGMLRTTYYPSNQASNLREKKWASESEDPENIYKTNIQIGELNALNACFAIIKFKQLRNFYVNEDDFLNSYYKFSSMCIMNESNKDES